MPSHLNTQLQFEAIPARTVYRRLPDMDRNTSQSSAMDLHRIATIRRSAEYKLRLENVKQDRDLRHVLGHLTILDHVDEEIVKSAQPTPVVSLPLPRSQSQQKLKPLEIEVCETEVSPNMDDDNDSDSSIDDDDEDDSNFWDDEENDSDLTLVRVQSHPPIYASIPTSPSERKDQSYQLYEPGKCAHDQNELSVAVQEVDAL